MSRQVDGHSARRRFGQNFLVAPGIIHKIVDAIAPRAGDTVVEIGPGLGALTGPLLERIDHLLVVEIDRDLIARLRDRFPPERLTIHEGDALEFDFGALKGPGPLKIVGNLPYNISSPLLFHLVACAPLVFDMHFMLQKEVVDRICAAPGSKKYGRLSVMMQYHCMPELLFEVPPESFDPIPQVTSAIVRLVPHQQPPVAVNDMSKLNRVVTQAFSQRRKTLRNSLKKLVEEADIAALGIDPTLRAESISLAEFALLSNLLQE